jgi:tetratricopeptide (TPR) repeat protein
MTQPAVAGPDASTAYLSRIESGQRRPDLPLLERFAARLEVSVQALLEEAPTHDLDEVRLALDYAELALESGEIDEVETRSRAVLDDGSAALMGMADRARYLHGRALEAQGRLDDAIMELERLTGSPTDLAWVKSRIALSRCLRESGDLTRAVESGDGVLAALIAAGLGACDEAVQLAVTVAAAYFERGDRGEAVRICRQAVDAAEASGSLAARSSAYWNASLIEAERGSTRAAVSLAERALALLSEGSDGRNLARLRTTLGDLYLSLDEPEIGRAERLLRQAAEELESSSAGRVDVARNRLARSRARLLAGDPVAAGRLAAEVCAEMTGIAPLVLADGYVVQGQAAAAMGDFIEAKDRYQRAVLVLTGVGADRSAAQLWYDIGSLWDDVGDLEASRDAYRRAAASSGLHGGHRVSRKALSSTSPGRG